MSVTFEKIRQAALKGQVDQLIAWREQGYDLNCQHENGGTPLSCCILFGEYDAARALVNAGVDLNTADFNIFDKQHQELFLRVACCNNLSFFRFMISKGLCAKDHRKVINSMIDASSNLDMFYTLIVAGVNIDYTPKGNGHALLKSIQKLMLAPELTGLKTGNMSIENRLSIANLIMILPSFLPYIKQEMIQAIGNRIEQLYLEITRDLTLAKHHNFVNLKDLIMQESWDTARLIYDQYKSEIDSSLEKRSQESLDITTEHKNKAEIINAMRLYIEERLYQSVLVDRDFNFFIKPYVDTIVQEDCESKRAKDNNTFLNRVLPDNLPNSVADIVLDYIKPGEPVEGLSNNIESPYYHLAVQQKKAALRRLRLEIVQEKIIRQPHWAKAVDFDSKYSKEQDNAITDRVKAKSKPKIPLSQLIDTTKIEPIKPSSSTTETKRIHDSNLSTTFATKSAETKSDVAKPMAKTVASKIEILPDDFESNKTSKPLWFTKLQKRIENDQRKNTSDSADDKYQLDADSTEKCLSFTFNDLKLKLVYANNANANANNANPTNANATNANGNNNVKRHFGLAGQEELDLDELEQGTANDNRRNPSV